MNSLFYAKLAGSNIKKNYRTYIPYIITCICTTAMYYIMYSLSTNSALGKGMFGGTTLQIILSLGTGVIAVFAVGFLFYTNSFLIKRRKKEFGLYNILGMEKKHIGRIMFFETLYCAIITLVLGIGFGLLLSKLMYLVLLKILQFDFKMGFEISPEGIVASLILFSVIFLLMLINSLRLVHMSKPIELLRGGQTGEKEPKTRWVLSVVGLLCLASAYSISIFVKNPTASIMLFFVAVTLVILGTYCLFTAGIIAILKLLRKNKSYYYKTSHFISVSGMIYRMKQNAAGLSNICILSTMVLVMVSTTASLYIGMEDALMMRYPYELSAVNLDYTPQSQAQITVAMESALESNGIEATDKIEYRYFRFTGFNENGTLRPDSKADYTDKIVSNFCFLPLEDYNRIASQTNTLNEDEVIVLSNRDSFTQQSVTLQGKTYAVKDVGGGAPNMNFNGAYNADMVNTFFIIVPSFDALDSIRAGFDGEIKNGMRSYLGVNIDAPSDVRLAVKKSLSANLLDTDLNYYTESRSVNRGDFLAMYGGLFFLGLFLGAVFIMAAVLIMYYKQISEGYDDKERFDIMQKVGLSKAEIRKSIGSQVLMVFFLPICAACVHLAFAFPTLRRMLAMLNLTNVSLFAVSTVVSCVVFALFYALVYLITARVYYKIVDKN